MADGDGEWPPSTPSASSTVVLLPDDEELAPPPPRHLLDYMEDVIDGFAIVSFTTAEELEVRLLSLLFNEFKRPRARGPRGPFYYNEKLTY